MFHESVLFIYLFNRTPTPTFKSKNASSVALAQISFSALFFLFLLFSRQTKVVSGCISPRCICLPPTAQEWKQKKEWKRRWDKTSQKASEVILFFCLQLLVRKAFIPQILSWCIMHELNTPLLQTLLASFHFFSLYVPFFFLALCMYPPPLYLFLFLPLCLLSLSPSLVSLILSLPLSVLSLPSLVLPCWNTNGLVQVISSLSTNMITLFLYCVSVWQICLWEEKA